MKKTESNIPKIIHYCWFGNKPLPKLERRCIESWKKYCPEYKIKRWSENNFDVNQIPYIQQAYRAGKYAFVSDYARFSVLEKYGGIYLDTDVELIRPLDEIIAKGSYVGCEKDFDEGIRLAPGLGIAAPPHNNLIHEIISFYNTLDFVRKDGTLNQTTIVQYTTELFQKHGLKNIPGIQKIEDFYVYPKEYFCPQHPETGKLHITPNTYSIHHYSASWYTPYEKFVDKLSHILGKKWTQRLVKIKKSIKKKLKSS